jgi:hypothetical protein
MKKLKIQDDGVAAIETDLEANGVRFRALGLELPEDLGEEVWAQLGRRLCRTDQVLKWWIGDWAACGMTTSGRGTGRCRSSRAPTVADFYQWLQGRAEGEKR